MRRLSMKSLVALLVLLTAGTAFFGAQSALGAAPWKTHGYGWAANHGGGVWSPDVIVDTTTLKDPTQVRYSIKNYQGESRRVKVEWALDCWRDNTLVTSKTGDYFAPITARGTLTKAPAISANAQWCRLGVWAEYASGSFGKDGKLSVKIEARYN